MATRFLPLFFTNVLLATCYPFACYLKGFEFSCRYQLEKLWRFFVALYRTESMVSGCLFQTARLFLCIFELFWGNICQKDRKRLRSGLIAIKIFLQIFSQICIDYSGVDFYQAKKFRARPDADPQPCPLEKVHILGTGKKNVMKIGEKREKQYGV